MIFNNDSMCNSNCYDSEVFQTLQSLYCNEGVRCWIPCGSIGKSLSKMPEWIRANALVCLQVPVPGFCPVSLVVGYHGSFMAELMTNLSGRMSPIGMVSWTASRPWRSIMANKNVLSAPRPIPAVTWEMEKALSPVISAKQKYLMQKIYQVRSIASSHWPIFVWLCRSISLSQ